MKRLTFFLVSYLILFVASSSFGRARDVSSIALPELRRELLERLDRDQAIRNELIKNGVTHPDAKIEARMTEFDSANTARMKEIVKRHGWPGPELVGVDGTEAAFLLVQHAEHGFQKEMLPLRVMCRRAGRRKSIRWLRYDMNRGICDCRFAIAE